MKHLVPSLSALALAGAAMAPLSAASIKDEKADLSLAVKGQLQTRLYVGASAEDTAGSDYNPIAGATGSPEALRFLIRRGRLGFDAKYGDGWFGNITMRFDGAASNNASVSETIYYAYAGKSIKTGEIEHEISGGLDKPMTYESTTSSSAYMLPFTSQAAIEGLRGVGAQYKLKTDMLRAGVSMMNTSTTSTANGINNEPSDGYFYTARVEIAPGASFMPAKLQESYLGTEGTHAVLGLEYITEQGKFSGTAASWTETDVSTWGPDLNVHWNALTAVAAFKAQTTAVTRAVDTGTPAANPDDVKGTVWTIGAAWAIPTETSGTFEPALRFSKADVNKDSDTEGSAAKFGDIDGKFAQSGQMVEVGVNWYLKGHANKFQLAYVNWKGEEGSTAATRSEATAHAVVLQHQLTF